jgi:hypothetical protein
MDVYVGTPKIVYSNEEKQQFITGVIESYEKQMGQLIINDMLLKLNEKPNQEIRHSR